jgi:hypothetical protein
MQVSTLDDFSNVVAAESGIAEDDDGVTSWTITRDLVEEDIYYWRVRALEGALIGPWTGPQQQFFLGANYPNPFNPSTQIRFALPEAATVELAVYDVLGQLVRTLVADEQHAARYYRVSWDGTDAQRQAVGSGVYFYRMRTPDFQQTGRMTLVK